MPPRVLFLVGNPTLGSTTRILQEWLQLARASAVDCLVVVKEAGKLTEWLAEHDIPYLVDTMPTPDRYWPIPAMYHAMRVVRWARRHGDISVVHCNEHDVYPFGLILRRLLQLPIIVHARFVLSPEFCSWAFRGSRSPNALLWTSNDQRRRCEDSVNPFVSQSQQHLIYLGVSPDAFSEDNTARQDFRRKFGVRPDAIVIGAACNFEPRKHMKDFIQAIQRLAANHDQVVGLFAGAAHRPEFQTYAQAAFDAVQKCGLGNRLQWVGNLTDMKPFYQAIDVFVSCSELETFGNSVCEAMASSRPVVAYQGGAVGEVIGNAGIVVENRDLNHLIHSLRTLVASAKMRREIGSAAKRRVEDTFHPRHSFKQLLQIYRDLRN